MVVWCTYERIETHDQALYLVSYEPLHRRRWDTACGRPPTTIEVRVQGKAPRAYA